MEGKGERERERAPPVCHSVTSDRHLILLILIAEAELFFLYSPMRTLQYQNWTDSSWFMFDKCNPQIPTRYSKQSEYTRLPATPCGKLETWHLHESWPPGSITLTFSSTFNGSWFHCSWAHKRQNLKKCISLPKKIKKCIYLFSIFLVLIVRFFLHMRSGLIA